MAGVAAEVNPPVVVEWQIAEIEKSHRPEMEIIKDWVKTLMIRDLVAAGRELLQTLKMAMKKKMMMMIPWNDVLFVIPRLFLLRFWTVSIPLAMSVPFVIEHYSKRHHVLFAVLKVLKIA